MFQTASIKLTAWYLGFLLVLSFGFSIAFYRVSVAEVDRGLNQQQVTLFRTGPFGAGGQISTFPMENLNQLREQQIQESKNHIIFNLLYFNLLVLSLGGLASYLLARKTLEPIEAALEAQNRFTGDASHELRTPLTAMRTEIEVSLRDKKLSLPESKELLASNLEEIQRLELLSASLLKLASGQVMDASLLRKVAIKELLGDLESRMNPVATKKEIVLTTDAEVATAKADYQSLLELLTIFVDNAIKYSPAKTKVHIRSYADARHVYLSVRDEGMGIKASDLPHLFERFYRADVSRSKEKVEGYGLGLAIADSIAKMHGGSIQVVSKLGSGSTFTLVLPLSSK